MSRFTTIVCIAGLALLAASVASATTVYLYADTAPNGYGSPDFAGWKTNAFAAAANGTFVNMASGANPGTTTFAPTEAIVYSYGDLGKRLHWIYWLPGETVSGLAGRFQVKDVADWDGVAYASGAYADGPEVEWYTPASWINYDVDGDGTTDGVIGTFGNAWWADNDPSTPYYGTVSETVNDMLTYQTYWDGLVRYRNSVNDPWTVQDLKLTLVPEPGSIVALLSGLAGLAGYGIRRRK